MEEKNLTSSPNPSNKTFKKIKRYILSPSQTSIPLNPKPC